VCRKCCRHIVERFNVFWFGSNFRAERFVNEVSDLLRASSRCTKEDSNLLHIGLEKNKSQGVSPRLLVVPFARKKAKARVYIDSSLSATGGNDTQTLSLTASIRVILRALRRNGVPVVHADAVSTARSKSARFIIIIIIIMVVRLGWLWRGGSRVIAKKKGFGAR
jgi:hypothetical protein